jgi:TonB family protein
MPPLRSVALSMLLLAVLAVLPFVAGAQLSSVVTDWDTLRPEGEEFSILMPKNSTAEISKEPYHKMTLNTRLYLSTNSAGPVFAVISLSGIKANPALYSEMERINSYIDAFKHWFPQKVRKDGIAKLVLAGEKTLNGHSGREYRLTIGDLSGQAQFYATRRRFYAVVYLNTKKDDSLQERFLSSFVLPQKLEEPPPAVATQKAEKKEAETKQEPVETQSDSEVKKAEAQQQGTEGAKQAALDTKSAEAAGQKAPISGGVLNGKALSLPPPEWPPEFKEITGTVVVQVTVDEQGGIITARVVSGPPQLHAAALTAARQAKFSPTLLMGEPVKVSGVILYNFTH